MESFADYILAERDWVKKLEIMYYLKKKVNIYFDSTVVFKALILRLFLDQVNLEVEQNLTLTASLLCNCKKIENPSDLSKVRSFAKEGADYLKLLGFEEKFCRTCEQVNRYSGSEPRELEADILEIIDQFGGMLLNRPERVAFKVQDALVLLEHRNLKDCNNQYLRAFKIFIEDMENVTTNYQSIVETENNQLVGTSKIGRGIISEFSEEFNKVNNRGVETLTMYDKEKLLMVSIKTASRLYEMAKLALEEAENRPEPTKVEEVIPTAADIEALRKMDEREFLKK